MPLTLPLPSSILPPTQHPPGRTLQAASAHRAPGFSLPPSAHPDFTLHPLSHHLGPDAGFWAVDGKEWALDFSCLLHDSSLLLTARGSERLQDPGNWSRFQNDSEQQTAYSLSRTGSWQEGGRAGSSSWDNLGIFVSAVSLH